METERIEERAEELIVNAIDFIEKSGSFVAEQAPLVVQEFLAYRLYESIVLGSILLAIVIALSAVGARMAISVLRNDDLDSEEKICFVSLGSLVYAALAAGPIIGTHHYVSAVAKIIVAPRVYLIEELPKLVGM